MKNRKISVRRDRFCYEYLLTGNAKEAAIKAGYSPKSAKVTGCRLLTDANLQYKIADMKKDLAETAGISALKIALALKDIAFGSVADLHDTWIERKKLEDLPTEKKAIIQEISTKVLKQNIGTSRKPVIVDVEYVKIKTYDKQKALESLTRLLGFDVPFRIELTGSNGNDLFATMSTEQLKREIASIERKADKARKLGIDILE